MLPTNLMRTRNHQGFQCIDLFNYTGRFRSKEQKGIFGSICHWQIKAIYSNHIMSQVRADSVRCFVLTGITYGERRGISSVNLTANNQVFWITIFSTSSKKIDAFWCPSRVRSSRNTDRMTTFGCGSSEGICPSLLSQAQIGDERYPITTSKLRTKGCCPGFFGEWYTRSQIPLRAVGVKPMQ